MFKFKFKKFMSYRPTWELTKRKINIRCIDINKAIIHLGGIIHESKIQGRF